MSVKAKNITDDGLPIFNKSVTPSTSSDKTEDGLPILKKKEESGGAPSKVSPSVSGVQQTKDQQPSTSASDIKPTGPKDWSNIENSIRLVSQRNDEYQKAQKFSLETGDIGEGISIPNQKFSEQFKKEAKDNLDKSILQKDKVLKENQQQLYEPIKNLLDNGKYKDFFDPMGNFKAADAISYFDKLTKANKAGNYTRDMMVSLLKQAGQYQLDQPERTKLREEEYKKAGINIDKYGIDLLNKLTTKQKSNVYLLESETKAKAANLLNELKPKSVEIGQQYMQQANEIKNLFQQKQISEEDANNRLKELNNKYHSQISQLDKEYQNGVRQLNINAQNKYGNINAEIQNIEKSVTDEMIWNSIPVTERKKIENINNKVENEIQRQHNILRQGLDIVSDAGQAPLAGLFQKSLKSGWYSGLANMGSYLSSKGYNNSLIRYLQGKEYEAEVNAPAEYTYKENFLKRSVTSTGTSLGASAPIMIPSIGIVAGTSGLGLPEIVGTIAAGLASYHGEKMQNTGQVYQQIMDQTGDPSKAIEGAKRYEDKQLIMMPLYFIEAAGLQNLLKGGIKKAVIGTAQELTQELPTEYWQNYTQAQETEGYKGSFGSYIKEHPETTLDVIASTLGQSGIVSMAGKVFNQISSFVPQSKAQFYADIIGKHGIDFAMENLQHQFNTGVIDEKTFQAEQGKLMLAAKKMKDFEGLGLKGEDAKAYFTLTESANRLKKAIGETEDEGLRIGYESKLKETQQELDQLVKGKGAYAIFTLPGGGEQTKIVPLSGIEKLDQEGHLNELIHLSDKVEVKGDENLNKQLQKRKQQLGNPAAPEGFYSTPTVKSTEATNKANQLEKSRSILEQSLKNGEIKGMQADVAQMVLGQSKENPEAIHQFFKDVADQSLNKVASEVGDPSVAAEQTYGKNIVDHARELFPAKPTYESIQQNATKAYENVAPVLQRMNNADYINEKELDNAANHLYDVLDQVDKSDMTDEQKQSSANLIEPLIQKIEGYDFRTKTETSTVTEAKTASIPTKTAKSEIKPALEKSAGSKATITSPDGSTATGILNIKSGQYVLDVPQGQQRIIGEKAITDRDLTLPTEEEMDNPIKFDKDGNVESITVKDRNGNLIEIKDAEKALDMAIQLRAEAIGEVPSQLFDNTYEEIQKEISQEKLIEPSKTQQDAKEIRENKGVPSETGKINERGKANSSSNVQQGTETGTKTGDTGKQIDTTEDFEKELAKELGLDDLPFGTLPKLGEINKENNIRPANEDISQYSNPKNVLDEAREFYKDNPVINRLIDFLKPIINANQNIQISELKAGDKVLGLSHPDGKIELNFNAIKDYDTLYRTALHEMVHAATRNEINTNQAFKDELGKVLSEVREALKLPENRTVMQLGILTGSIDNFLYGGTDEFELLAEVFTNDKFHDALKNIQYKGDSLLSRIFNFIAKWFSDNYKQLSEAKENIKASNIADYLMDLTGSVVKGIQGTDESGMLASIKGNSENNTLKNGDTLYNTLNNLKRSYPIYSDLVDRLLKISDKKSLHVKIELWDAEKQATRAFYNSKSDKIYFDGNFQDKPRYIIHEAIHAMTTWKIPEVYSPRATGDRYSAFINGQRNISINTGVNKEAASLINLYKQAIRSSGLWNDFLGEGGIANDTNKKGLFSEEKYRPYYGFYNIHEFLSEAFSNKVFQDKLKELKVEDRSIWDIFVDFVRNIFGFDSKTLLDKVLSVGEKIISKERPAEHMGYNNDYYSNIDPTQDLKANSIDDKIKNVISRTAPSLTDEQIRESIKKVTGLDDSIINKLINEVRGKDISQQKQKTNETEAEKAKAQEAERLRNEVTSQSGIGKEGVAGSESVTPSSKPPTPPSEPVKTTVGSPKEEWTAIRKAKLQEIKAVKDMFEANAERKKWAGIIESALNNLQEMYPDKSLYDAARDRVARFSNMFDNKVLFNPTSEDLAVFQYFKAETEKSINDIQGWDSQNEVERMFSVSQWKSLQDDLLNVSNVINPSEAARAFGFRQSELKLDPEYGLQVRRMQLLDAKGGERLTEEEKEWTSAQWDKEKELMKQEQELKEKRMVEEFDKRLLDIKKQYDEKLKKARKSPTKKEKADEKRENYLKNKGKEWADKIRKGKLGDTQVSIPGVTPLINLAIEGVAKLVETGFTIADAIDKYVKDNKLKESEENAIKDHFDRFIDQQIKQQESFDKIKELAKNNQVTSITTDMVSKNLVKDFVESHIGEIEPGKLLDHVTNKLEEVLPNLTKQKLTEAYLKTGEFRIPTKQELQSAYDTDKSKLQKIAKIEKDINDLKSKKDIFNRSGNKSQEKVVDKDISAREKELKKIMVDTGLKTSNEDKFSKASNETRAQAHNDRIAALSNKIDDLLVKGNLTSDQQAALSKLKGQLDVSKIKLDENSKLSQKAVMDNADNLLKKIQSDFDKSLKLGDMLPVAEVRKGLRQAVDKFNTEKEESEQKLKLQRAKDNLERSNKETLRKINAGEFNDEKVPTILKSTDAQLIKLQIEKNKLDSEIRKKQKELGEKNKSLGKKLLETTRALYVAALIYRFGTFAKVAAAAVMRPNIEAATKLTFGQIFKQTFPEFYNRAKAGGESSSLRAVKESYTALLRQVGDKKMLEIKDKAYNKYNTDRDAYNAYQKVAESMPDDKKVKARLEGLKENMNNSLLDATSVFVYDYIGSSSIKDSLDALLHRSNKIERELGHLDAESIKDGSAIDKINYVIGFIGRSHSAMKSFSARANFSAGFIARLEDAIHNGVDVSNPDEILKIGHESYLDWERGKYQQKNLVTDLWNEITQRVENYAKGTAWEKYSKAIAEGLRFDVAITRVPVNILHEAVMEYTIGSFRAFYKIGQEYRTANKQVALNTDLNPDTKEFKDAVKNQISKMDATQAATIARCFRKGGFGLGLYAMATITGLIAFGGFHHKGEKKKKEEDLEEGELNPGEIMIGHKKMGDLVSKIIEHTPAAYPTLFGLNLAKVYADNIEKGKTTLDAAMSAAIANLEAIQDAIPQAKVINPIGITQDVTKGALRQADKFWEWTDVDEKGDVINRKPMDFKDQIKLLMGDRKNVLTEDNYKTATSIMKDYNSAISDLQKAKADKEQIEELKRQRDEQIKQIYEMNKEQK